jgi:hypothetical protein
MAAAFSELARERDLKLAGQHAVVCEDDLMQLAAAELGIGILPQTTPCPHGLRRIRVEGLDITRTASCAGDGPDEASARQGLDPASRRRPIRFRADHSVVSQPSFGCVPLKLGRASMFVHHSANPSTSKTASLSGVKET